MPFEEAEAECKPGKSLYICPVINNFDIPLLILATTVFLAVFLCVSFFLLTLPLKPAPLYLL